jgi:hypothetical protein
MTDLQQLEKAKFSHSIENYVIALYGQLTDFPKSPTPEKKHKAYARTKAHETYVALKYIFKREKPSNPALLLEVSDIMKKITENKGHIVPQRDPVAVREFIENYGAFLLRNKDTIMEMQNREVEKLEFAAGEKDGLTKRLIKGALTIDPSRQAKDGIRDFIFENPFWYDPKRADSPAHDQMIRMGLMLNRQKQEKRIYENKDGPQFILQGKTCVVLFQDNGQSIQHIYKRNRPGYAVKRDI